jgi:hypothetical protein
MSQEKSEWHKQVNDRVNNAARAARGVTVISPMPKAHQGVNDYIRHAAIRGEFVEDPETGELRPRREAEQ